MDHNLTAHLDLTETTVYSVSDPRYVMVEFTTRGPIVPVPGRVSYYSLSLDADHPWWVGDDRDFLYGVGMLPDGRTVSKWDAVKPYDSAADDNKIGLLIGLREYPGIAASANASTADWSIETKTWGQGNRGSRFPALIKFPDQPFPTDLSQPDPEPSVAQSEVFRYPMIQDIAEVSCQIIEAVGDEADFFAFNSQFRVDQQETGPAHGFAGFYSGNIKVEGIGIEGDHTPPCETRLSNTWGYPVWMKAASVANRSLDRPPGQGPYDAGLTVFAHEIGHTWLAYAAYMKDGRRELLKIPGGYSHWNRNVHSPAPFPWRGTENSSIMGGNFWHENIDGTFTPTNGWHSRGGGFSWLDLYLMGLATPDEVPDMFVLRNLQETGDGWDGPHTGEKETVTIEQIIDAMGTREPSAEWDRTTFNIGFVYFLLPGQEPDCDLLREHGRYRDRALEHWIHITGGRGQLTTGVGTRLGRRSARSRAGCSVSERTPRSGRSRIR